MKKTLLPLMGLMLCIISTAQQQPTFINNPYPKTITVSGSAELNIVPDEIYVNIELKEYQKKGENKKDLETIKSQFLKSCKDAGIPDSTISIASYSGDGSYYDIRKKKRGTDLFAGITYQIKFNTSKAMDELVEKLDDEATQKFIIASVGHSRMTEFRKALKTKAVQAAKEKGIYLTEAIGEKLGEAITINEPNEWEPLSFNNGFFSNIAGGNMSQTRETVETPASSDVDFKKMKLRFEVSVIFALK